MVRFDDETVVPHVENARPPVRVFNNNQRLNRACHAAAVPCDRMSQVEGSHEPVRVRFERFLPVHVRTSFHKREFECWTSVAGYRRLLPLQAAVYNVRTVTPSLAGMKRRGAHGTDMAAADGDGGSGGCSPVRACPCLLAFGVVQLWTDCGPL